MTDACCLKLLVFTQILSLLIFKSYYTFNCGTHDTGVREDLVALTSPVEIKSFLFRGGERLITCSMFLVTTL